MSGLSAKTYSCAGDGDRLRGGGEASFAALVAFWPLGSLLKNLRMVPFLGWGSGSGSESRSEGTGDSDDSDDRSDESSAILEGAHAVVERETVASCCVVEGRGLNLRLGGRPGVGGRWV